MKHLGLSFDIDLRDKITGKVGKVQKQLDGLAATARKSFLQIGTGAAGVWGAGVAMGSIIGPARQMQRSLGEVKSLGVADKALKQLNRTSLAFSIQFGTDAASVAASAYDIQSSISGLDGKELASFTKASNVLAKGTKADAGTITNYMGTMYGIFKNQANEMGKAAWVEQLTGQTATAVQMFKTTGMEMSSAFTSVGAAATSAGISASEQMAILGTLQSTMSGSEAGTKYKAFLSGIGGAQEKLGLSFTDSNGNMLGMMDILGKLRGKFGDTFDVDESDALKKAFGSDEAVGMIKLLMADVDGLGNSMKKLDGITGMDQATKMAKDMVDPMDRLSQGGNALRIVLGQALLPTLNPIINGFADASATMVEWGQKYPNLMRWIGYGVMTVLGFTAALGVASMAAGFMRVTTLGLTNVMKPMNWALGIGKKAWAAYTGAQWLANTALLGFPLTWIVAALVGVGAAVGAVIYWWDDLKAVFLDCEWAQTIMKVFDFATMFSPLRLFITLFKDGISGVFDQVMGWFNSLGGMVGWVIEKLNLLPGVNISVGESATAPPVTSAALDAPHQMQSAGKGGVSTQIANSMSKQTTTTTNIGKVENRFEHKVDPQEAMLMAGA